MTLTNGAGPALCVDRGEALEIVTVKPDRQFPKPSFQKPQTNRRGGRRSRDKGNRAERAIVRFFQDRGFAAERVPLSGAAGGSYVGDLTVPIVGRDLRVEVKVRSAGFGQLYAWLKARDVLIVRADRREPLVVVPLRLAAEIATTADRGKVAS